MKLQFRYMHLHLALESLWRAPKFVGSGRGRVDESLGKTVAGVHHFFEAVTQ